MWQSYPTSQPATPNHGLAAFDLGNIIKLPPVQIEAQADKSLQTTVLVAAGILVVGAIAIALINRG